MARVVACEIIAADSESGVDRGWSGKNHPERLVVEDCIFSDLVGAVSGAIGQQDPRPIAVDDVAIDCRLAVTAIEIKGRAVADQVIVANDGAGGAGFDRHADVVFPGAGRTRDGETVENLVQPDEDGFVPTAEDTAERGVGRPSR